MAMMSRRASVREDVVMRASMGVIRSKSRKPGGPFCTGNGSFSIGGSKSLTAKAAKRPAQANEWSGDCLHLLTSPGEKEVEFKSGQAKGRLSLHELGWAQVSTPTWHGGGRPRYCVSGSEYSRS